MIELRARRAALAPAILGLAAGCATVPSVPLTDIRVIEGKWRGTITVGMGAPQFYYLTVNPDSTIVNEWGMNWQWGTITLSGGKARFEISHLTSGDLLYFNDAKESRVITMTPDFGGWYVYATPLNLPPSSPRARRPRWPRSGARGSRGARRRS